MGASLYAAVLCLLLMSTVGFWLTNDAQDQPYMDEVFHIPQAQQYCRGNFSHWDPMITTLPGLYLVSLPVLYPLAVVMGRGDMATVCTTAGLRGVNILFSVANFYILYLISCKLHATRKNKSEVVLTALALATFPVLYFFTFLYYTDPVAVCFALLVYYLTLRSNHLSAAIVGMFAIICRQTNIVWLVFGTGLTIGRILLKWIQLDKDRERKSVSDWVVLSKTLRLVGQSCRHNPKALFGIGQGIVKEVWSYVVVGAMFVMFVWVNEGITVGDRSNHQPCLNFPQLFYFLFITTVFAFMHIISIERVLHFYKFLFRHPLKTLLFCLVAVVFVTKFMFIHEYNLADNRHYNFYFLSKLVLRNKYMKYMLIPAYLYSFMTVYNLLRNRDVFWKASYLICSAASMVPQRLIEFRYFIIPYLLIRLNMPMPSKLFLYIEILFYFAINAVTVYMYVYRPFTWASADGFQRFMW